MIYRIVLLGGPHDGEALVAGNPWYEVTVGQGYVYRAKLDDNDDPVLEDFVEEEGSFTGALTVDGSFVPADKTIRMRYSHKLSGSEMKEWKDQWDKYIKE